MTNADPTRLRLMQDRNDAVEDRCKTEQMQVNVVEDKRKRKETRNKRAQDRR